LEGGRYATIWALGDRWEMKNRMYSLSTNGKLAKNIRLISTKINEPKINLDQNLFEN
jgi:hypothetical protein